jgi:hypothetical protein
MARIYVILIQKGLRTPEQVPALWQAGVEALLETMGSEE